MGPQVEKSSFQKEATINPTTPLLTFSAKRSIPKKCPFSNEHISFTLRRGTCIRLAGNSGIGKTTLANYIAGLSSPSHMSRLGISIPTCDWNASIPAGERCGVLFQQTTLLDTLSLAGNIAVALINCPTSSDHHAKMSRAELDVKIKQLLDMVGLSYAHDAHKRPTQLSGGMARRASLALQLAQRKRVIILDEPFAGLDWDAAVSVAKELMHLRRSCGTALILISHEPDLCRIVMGGDDGGDDDGLDSRTVTLEPPVKSDEAVSRASFFGMRLSERFLEDLLDFVMWSLPLILLAFTACGLAIAMLTCDVLQKIDVTDKVVAIVEKEVKPMIKMLTGEDPTAITMMMIKLKVKNMINTTMPGAKASLYAIGMAKLFVLEIGPLLTALLLCGRIGGSYAGKVGTMQATKQNELLTTLGVNAQAWTLVPALGAAVLAGPILTVMGTVLSLVLGGVVGPAYGIGKWDDYVESVREAVFPGLRLRSVVAWNENGGGTFLDFFSGLDLRYVGSDKYTDAFVEFVTYPPFFLLTKAVTFIVMVLMVAELAARLRPDLTPRKLPSVITSSVVISSLVVILMDWGFSQLWLLRK